MDDFEEETVEGVIVNVRGPASDGTYELDLKQANGEVVAVTVSGEQYLGLVREVEGASGDEGPNRQLN
jgi:hypothetical protein